MVLILYPIACEIRAEQGWETSLLVNKNSKEKDGGFFAKDKWLSWDKFEHFLAGFGGAWALGQFKMKDGEIMITVVSTATLWEVKDYFMSWKKYGWWGGDKFSWKDGIATIAGGGLYILTRKGF